MTFNISGTGSGKIVVYINGWKQTAITASTTISAAAGSTIFWVVDPNPSHMITAYNLNGVDVATPCWRDTVMYTDSAFALNASQTLNVTFDDYSGTQTGVGPCTWCAETSSYSCSWERSGDDTQCSDLTSRLVETFAFGQDGMRGNWFVTICGGGSDEDAFRLEADCDGSTINIPSSTTDSRVLGSATQTYRVNGCGSDYWAIAAGIMSFKICSDCDDIPAYYLYVIPDPYDGVSAGHVTWWSYYIIDPATACGTVGAVTVDHNTGTDSYATYSNDPFKDGDCCDVTCTNYLPSCTVGSC